MHQNWMKPGRKKLLGICLIICLSIGLLSGCGTGEKLEKGVNDSFQGSVRGQTIKILSGSENKELADVLTVCSKETGVNIEMTYKGSVDIMNILKEGAPEYDAVWPASSLWISLGDTNIDYYQETASSLLQKYATIEDTNLDIKEVLQIKENTIRALETLNGAFEQQFQKLMHNEIFDMEAQVKLLEQTVKMEKGDT